MSEESTKKMTTIHSNVKDDLDDALRAEYDFGTMEMKPNRFAALFQDDQTDVHLVALDADVAADYPTAEEVNAALRRLVEIRTLAQMPLTEAVVKPAALTK